MPYDVTFTQETLCKGAIRNIGDVLNVDDETARMLVDLGVATASGLSPQTGSSAALFADTFLAKADNLASIASPTVTRANIDALSTSELAAATANFPRKVATWDNATAYNVGDFVSFSGSTFVCIQSHTNRAPFAEQAYWQLTSYGWNWMVLPWKALGFGNLRSSGTGVDSASTTAMVWVRTGLSTTTTANNAIALYRVLSVGVPSYAHHYFDSSYAAQSGFNNINFGKAGKFQAAFSPTTSTNAITAGTVMYLDVGRTYSEVSGSGTISPLNAPLDKRGFGIRMVCNGTGGFSDIFVVYHDGVTRTETAISNTVLSVFQMNKFEVCWDGFGNYIYFINGSEVHRRAGGQDYFGFPTWGAIAVGIYNAPNTSSTNVFQMIWVVSEETGFILSS